MKDKVRILNYHAVSKSREALERAMNPQSEDYASLRKRFIEMGNKDAEINRTTLWFWMTDVKPQRCDYPGLFFNSTPPLAEASLGNRILIVGTNREVSDMNYGLEDLGGLMIACQKHGWSQELVSNAKRAGSVVREVMHEKGIDSQDAKYTYASSTNGFWHKFFGKKKFLDSKNVSIPKLIISTGLIRDYREGAGASENVRERLTEIASSWKIPIEFIPSWAI